MKLLIDTNILLSALLEQNDYKSSVELLRKIENHNIPCYLSEFGIYSICLLLHKRKNEYLFKKLIEYIENKKNFRILNFELLELAEMFRSNVYLDLDDKIHYHLAKQKNLQLISFDTDFDKTDLKRLTPAQALDEFF